MVNRHAIVRCLLDHDPNWLAMARCDRRLMDAMGSLRRSPRRGWPGARPAIRSTKSLRDGPHAGRKTEEVGALGGLLTGW